MNRARVFRLPDIVPCMPVASQAVNRITRFRRGSQSSSVHAKVQSPCKSAGNSIVANDDNYALAA
jgi:hypothetical protein